MSAFILSIVSFNYNSTGGEGIKEVGTLTLHTSRRKVEGWEAAHITGERKTCMCQVRIQCWLYTSVEDLRTIINNDKL